jgi:hypothetical protein
MKTEYLNDYGGAMLTALFRFFVGRNLWGYLFHKHFDLG